MTPSSTVPVQELELKLIKAGSTFLRTSSSLTRISRLQPPRPFQSSGLRERSLQPTVALQSHSTARSSSVTLSSQSSQSRSNSSVWRHSKARPVQLRSRTFRLQMVTASTISRSQPTCCSPRSTLAPHVSTRTSRLNSRSTLLLSLAMDISLLKTFLSMCTDDQIN
jgi:hypothetical protein